MKVERLDMDKTDQFLGIETHVLKRLQSSPCNVQFIQCGTCQSMREVKVGAWLIDFAKCHRIEGGGKLTHRRPWDLGNHEDGYLIGLDNLMELLEGNEEEEEGNDENNNNNEERINLKFNREKEIINGK
uniref:Kinase n=1 Tax=Meloidogyne javanica TaxID=6303 RepID=A0A915MAC8_MELJA